MASSEHGKSPAVILRQNFDGLLHFLESMDCISGQGRPCGVTLASKKLSPEPARYWGPWLEGRDTSNNRILRFSNGEILVELNLVDLGVSANENGKDLYHC